MIETQNRYLFWFSTFFGFQNVIFSGFWRGTLEYM